jgi:hypothetical protein
MSGPIFGLCPTSRDWLKESSGNPLTGRDWIQAPPEAPKNRDDTDDVMTMLALKKVSKRSKVRTIYSLFSNPFKDRRIFRHRTWIFLLEFSDRPV